MKTRDIAIIGILVGLSFVLGMIKFAGSIALDSAPAFLAVFVFKDYKGAAIGAIGHLLSAVTSGFPFGLPIHLATAAIMFVMLYLAAIAVKKFNIVVGVGIILLINAFIAPLVVFIAAPFTMAAYTGLVASLGLATIANLVIALILYKPAEGALIKYGNYQ